MPDNREIILEALLLNDKGEYADKIIKSILDKYSFLERYERSFINRVFTGTVERKLTLDYIINSYSSVKINKQKPVIRAILRMSVYQLMYMDSVPDSAVINEAVKLAKKKKFNGLTGFVNGVLRKISREKADISLPDDLSIKYSMPEWICSHFIDECDGDVQKAERIIANSLCERPVVIRTNISKITPAELEQELISEGVVVKHTDISEGSLLISDFDGLSGVEAFNKGLFCVQDTSSQRVFVSKDELVDREITDRLKSASLIVDVCAAPGGKTCHAADLLKYYGNDKCVVISRDLTDNKADRIDENVERCGFDNVETEVWDALEYDEALNERADIVIADLPCSGLGVIGRKADIKYRVTADDLKALSLLQKEILSVIYRYVKPGGMLIFSTCTVNRTENADNAAWIANNLPFRQLGDNEQIYNDSPERDGFFISRFIRIAGAD